MVYYLIINAEIYLLHALLLRRFCHLVSNPTRQMWIAAILKILIQSETMGPEFVKRLSYILASFFFFATVHTVGTTSASNGLVLESIEVIAEDDKPEQVVFKLNGSHTPSSFRLEGDNPRLVFDFYGVKYPSEVYRIDDVGGSIISTIRVGRHLDPPKIRVVVDIQQDSPYFHEQTFNVSNNSLVVTFTRDLTQISKQQEPTSMPPRIEAASTKIVISEDQTEPKSKPYIPDEEKSTGDQGTPVEMDETPPENIQEPTEDHDKTVEIAKTSPENIPEPTEDLDTPVEIAKTSPENIPEPTEDLDTPVEIAETPPENIQEPITSSSEGETQAPSTPVSSDPPVSPEPAPPVAPSEPGGTDQQSQVAKLEPPAEPLDTETENIIPVLLDVSFEKSINESETVLFRLNHFYPPLVFGIEKGEPRVVCDFFDAEIDDNVPQVIEAGGQFVNRIMVTNESDPDKVRVELVLMPNRNYDLQQLFFKEDNLFVIIVKELSDDSAAVN